MIDLRRIKDLLSKITKYPWDSLPIKKNNCYPTEVDFSEDDLKIMIEAPKLVDELTNEVESLYDILRRIRIISDDGSIATWDLDELKDVLSLVRELSGQWCSVGNLYKEKEI